MINKVKNKKVITLIAVFLIVLLLVLIFIITIKEDKEVLKVNYNKTNEIQIKNITNNYKNKIEISIYNNTDKTKEYNLNIENVKNTFLTQSNLLYKISSKESDREIVTSQLPVVETTLFRNVKINNDETHNYTMTIWTTAASQNNKEQFSGTINVQLVK